MLIVKTLALTTRLRLASIITRLHVQHHKELVGLPYLGEAEEAESRPSS